MPLGHKRPMRSWLFRAIAAIGLTLAFAAGAVDARADERDPAQFERGKVRENVLFATGEREMIRDWLRRTRRAEWAGRNDSGPDRSNLRQVAPFADGLVARPAEQPALRSFRGAAPGLRYRLERGDRLPAGVTRQYLPDELSRQLPHYAGHDRVVYGEDVYLVQRGTGIVQDVLRGAMRE